MESTESQKQSNFRSKGPALLKNASSMKSKIESAGKTFVPTNTFYKKSSHLKTEPII